MDAGQGNESNGDSFTSETVKVRGESDSPQPLRAAAARRSAHGRKAPLSARLHAHDLVDEFMSDNPTQRAPHQIILTREVVAGHCITRRTDYPRAIHIAKRLHFAVGFVRTRVRTKFVINRRLRVEL